MTEDKQISSATLALKTQIENFIMDNFPNPQRWKEHPHENSTRALEVWENLLLLVVNFDAYDLLMENQFMEHDLAVYRSAKAAVTQPASNLQ